MVSSFSDSSPVPHIHLLCIHSREAEAFKAAAQAYGLPPSIQITHHSSRLHSLAASALSFDCIVSPANSYGLLDGAFDDAISLAFSPADDYYALTRHVQAQLYEQRRGFAPPGTCTLLDIPQRFAERSRTGDRWGCRWLALCPTMRMPSDANWNREVVYECVWSLLCALDLHNRRAAAALPASAIKQVLMTPLATGVGRVSAERWAAQVVLALKHYVQAVENPTEHSALEWDKVGKISIEVEKTHSL